MKEPIVTKSNLVIGGRVKRGPDWQQYYGNQDVGSAYGVIIRRHPNPENAEDWVRVVWYDESGSSIAEENSYRISYADLVYLPKFKIGDSVKICGSFKCNRYGWKNSSRVYYAVDGIGNDTFKIKDYHWDEKKKEFYYDYNSGWVAEHALHLNNDIQKPTSKYKIGDNLVISNNKHAKAWCKLTLINSKDHYHETLCCTGESLGKVKAVHYSDVMSMYYYQFEENGQDCYREDCLALEEKSITNNQNQNQNGESNNNTEVPRLIESESIREGSTGVTIQSRRRKASVVSGSVSYQKIVGKR
jgi:hypothetical protein